MILPCVSKSYEDAAFLFQQTLATASMPKHLLNILLMVSKHYFAEVCDWLAMSADLKNIENPLSRGKLETIDPRIQMS